VLIEFIIFENIAQTENFLEIHLKPFVLLDLFQFGPTRDLI